MSDLKDRCDEVQHVNMFLSGSEPDMETPVFQPKLGFWVDADDDANQAVVAVMIGPLWGQDDRFINFTTEQARSAASLLTKMADAADAINREGEQ